MQFEDIEVPAFEAMLFSVGDPRAPISPSGSSFSTQFLYLRSKRKKNIRDKPEVPRDLA